MVNGPKFGSVSKNYFPLGTYERYIESSGKSQKECLLDSERPKEEHIEELTLQLALEDDWILITNDGGEGMRKSISGQGNTVSKSER